jgi:O-antigen/teichoic acid export membrane protein
MAKLNPPSLKINAASNWATLFVNVMIGFVLTPFVIRHLGRTGYGIWTLVGSFVGYYGILNLGVGSAIIRYVARHASRNDCHALNETVSTAATMFCCTGLLAAGASLALAGPLAAFFGVEPNQAEAFKQVVRLAGISTGLSFSSNVFGAVIRAHERFIVVNLASIGVALIRAGLTVVVLMRGYGLSGVAAATLITEMLQLTTNIVLCRYLIPAIRVRLSLARINVIRMLLKYGSIITFLEIAGIFRSGLDGVVIGKWVGLPAVGIFSIAITILGNIANLVTAGMSVLTPRFAALDGKGEHEKIRQLLIKSLAVSSFLSFGGYMMAIILGKQFVLWWVGAGFADAALILWILPIGSAVAIAQSPAIGFMHAVNKLNCYAAVTIIEAVTNLLLSIILVHRYGILGVALGTVIPMLIVHACVMPIYVSRIAGLSLREYLRPILLPAMIVASLIMLTGWAGIIIRKAISIEFLLAEGLRISLVYIAAYYFVIRLAAPTFLYSMLNRRNKDWGIF